MTAEQPEIQPPPPDGYTSWLDYILASYDVWLHPDTFMYAQAELAALRQALADRSADLAVCLNDLESVAKERDEAMHEAFAESYKLKALLVRCVNEGTDGGADDDVSLEFLGNVPAECAAVKKQRDEARAKLAELRAEQDGEGKQ